MTRGTVAAVMLVAGVIDAGAGLPPSSESVQANEVVLVGAGDIALCRSLDDEATAALLDSIPGTVFTAGDNAYPSGSPRDYRDCYEPSWGRHKHRTRPAPGNHDYRQPGAAGYFEYFGEAAGPSRGYYSYDIGAWHVIVLNTNVSARLGSPQERWLREDLARSGARCTVAIWHHPRFSSGTKHGGSLRTSALWQALYDGGAELVLSGHEHNYERFAPQTADGHADPERGIRQIVVGTGGAGLYPFGSPAPNSEARNNTTLGVLKLTLRPASYAWAFVPVAGGQYRDSGEAPCH